MANPNKIVSSARNKKMCVIDKRGFNSEFDALAFASEYKKQYPERVLRTTSYKYGSFKKPSRGYMVHIYEK